MLPELNALYQIHRYQILLNAKDSVGNYKLPTGYLYAVSKGIYPYWHQEWCGENGNDPYLECYDFKQDLVEEIINLLERKELTYSELERTQDDGRRIRRHRLWTIIRYCYLSETCVHELYFESLFNSSCSDSAAERSGICKPLTDEELMPLLSQNSQNRLINSSTLHFRIPLHQRSQQIHQSSPRSPH
jgi:hypothetical protein